MKLRALLVLLASVALVIPAATASADSLVTTDPSGDVLKADQDGEILDPDQANGDIIRTAITHGPGKVKVKIAFRDLARNGQIVTYLAVRSNKGRAGSRNIVITAGPKAYYGKVKVTKASGKKVTCRVARNLDYAANTATVAIPRRCLGSPRWVRVGIGVITTQGGLENLHVDDARGDGKLGGRDPYLSPKLFR